MLTCFTVANRYANHYFKSGTTDDHFLFDTPPHQSAFNPKIFEHHRRDTCNTSKTTTHEHIDFTPSSCIPSAWRTFLQCRQCKRSIIEAIGLSFLQKGKSWLSTGQKLVFGGCFEGDVNSWSIEHGECTPLPAIQYLSNATEADFQIWKHAVCSTLEKILIYSPDTDVYNIGLSFVHPNHKEYIIQLNPVQAEDKGSYT